MIEATRGVDLISAPSLPWEVGNALSALFRRARLELSQARVALESFRRIPVRLAPLDVEPAVALAERHGIYAYDAYLIECALRYQTPLLSLDRRQCEVAVSEGVRVVEVER